MRTGVQPRGGANPVQILQTLPDTFLFHSWYQLYIIKWQNSERQKTLLFAYRDGGINYTDFAMLYDLNFSKNLEFPY